MRPIGLVAKRSYFRGKATHKEVSAVVHAERLRDAFSNLEEFSFDAQHKLM